MWKDALLTSGTSLAGAGLLYVLGPRIGAWRRGRLRARAHAVLDRVEKAASKVADRVHREEAAYHRWAGLIGKRLVELTPRRSRPRTALAAAGIGLAAGAGLMYLFDPDQGAGRRAQLRDRVAQAGRTARREVSAQAVHAADQLRGVLARAGARFKDEEVNDDKLVRRVRAVMGHVIVRPREVTVRARDGWISLGGTLSTTESENLVRCVSALRGVRGVRNELTAAPSEPAPAGIRAVAGA